MRDTRRAHLPGGSIKLERGQLDVHAPIDALEVRWGRVGSLLVSSGCCWRVSGQLDVHAPIDALEVRWGRVGSLLVSSGCCWRVSGQLDVHAPIDALEVRWGAGHPCWDTLACWVAVVGMGS